MSKRLWAAVCYSVLLLGGATTLTAVAAASDGLPSDAYSYRIPLLRQYPEQGVTLLGQDAYAGMDFGLRKDERVVGARLELDVRYSDTLLPGLSHLNVLVNSVVATTIPLPQLAPLKSAHVSVDLPVALLSDFNHLNLELIAHSKASDQGNNPDSPDLWLKAAPNSALVVTVVPAPLPSDLARLPAPFVDKRDVRRVNLPVVLSQAPTMNRLESAGVVTSWLGAQAGYRGARFSAYPGAIPPRGNGVVLALAGEVPGLTLPVINGPTLAIIPNPLDANGKLLLVTGRNEAELRQAATALVLGSQTLTGSQVRIDSPIHVLPRKPFDAPNWLPSDRPVRLGELASADAFTVSGFSPGSISVGLRLPPGLFGFDSAGAELDLHYRYTARPESLHSELHVLVGNSPIQTLPLAGDTSDGHAVMRIPTYLLPPLTTLQFDYRYDAVKPKENWQDVPGGPLQSAIDPASTIDISNLPRYAAMPDLRAFGDAGFPFTRMADLSETAVILPVDAVADDYSAYLTLMGSMGQASGYPVLGVTAVDPGQVSAVKSKDLLVLASGNNQPLVNAWHKNLPAGFFGPVASSDGAIRDFWENLTNGRTAKQRADDLAVLYSGGDHDGMVAGLESPLTRGRSAVVVSGKSPAALDAVVDLLQAHRYLIGASRTETVGGSLVIAHDGVLTTLEDKQNYFLGTLPFRLAVQWFLASHIVLLLISTLVSVVLIGLLGGVFLHLRALKRLDLDIPQASQPEEGRRGSHV
ncbi:cellulose biosynthesis cyclic di-GMP-binding regulatory protein BcsB [Robbsia andropogonis]|uniref:cellulose biosynthesis cyclic di-GMP-binding regulatory protein BcsB n=2 Tax=Robbsia andropogonis TaxID=28092 RepID=UPI002A69ABA6|nr:cellulose biosynthesis cyclic di-GMP-binding regulatory protein BcsB [Robbsia andropogonis]